MENRTKSLLNGKEISCSETVGHVERGRKRDDLYLLHRNVSINDTDDIEEDIDEIKEEIEDVEDFDEVEDDIEDGNGRRKIIEQFIMIAIIILTCTMCTFAAIDKKNGGSTPPPPTRITRQEFIETLIKLGVKEEVENNTDLARLQEAVGSALGDDSK